MSARNTRPLIHRLLFGSRHSLWLLLFCLVTSPARAEIVWHWKDAFTAEEKTKLTRWVSETTAAVEQHVAPFPFDLHIFFYRRQSQREPVPWANTRRSGIQGVNFYVDPDYPLQAFLDDWTAPHELSHLLIPYLGRQHAWFAEGFASYMQFQIMQQMGVLSAEQVQARYRVRVERAARRYRYDDRPFAEAALRLRENSEYPTMYWGGAVYFLDVDKQLRKDGISLRSVLTDYVRCCRVRNHDLEALTQELDRLSRTKLFSETLADNRLQTGFPAFQHLMQ
ncbi:hypothetical protein AUP74_00140 [Microbulbifer aggregans]|uniref:Peptidase MA-like domain-containing protein n=1 Tax=Microbulbifer aggregans TaxID=1769779 RepID=A0A1C9W379_9GAMM|nr:hypothetical protein [Microbulbifer aggregans]AOS95616.1 hypothetical protein AUP74_00140 [Microbulbifer aggregans]